MAGKLCSNDSLNRVNRVNTSKAYCEGMAHRASDTAANAPVTDNPHEIGSEDSDGWIRGWDLANESAGGNMAKADYGCCAAVGAIPA